LWWGVAGFKIGSPPLQPLEIRQKLAADAAVKHQEALAQLLHIVELLRNEVERLENRRG
jgi:hypothetical protein